jgi:hypothetical protein
MAKFCKPGEPETLIQKISQETLAKMIGTTRSRVSYFFFRVRLQVEWKPAHPQMAGE